MKPQKHSPCCSFGLAHLLALPLVAWSLAAIGDPTDLSETPISGASSMEIKPNILFILDDSYSMDWTYLPDWAGEIIYDPGTGREKKWRPSSYQSYNANFNGVAYNPAVRYLPPSYFDEQGQADAKTYPSQTGGAATQGWTQVPLDGYGVQSKDKVDLVGNAFYYQTVPGEFCTDRTLRDCRDKAEDAYTVPATLRWCQTAADATQPNPKNAGDPQPACQAVFIDDSGAKGGGSLTYMYPRMPAPRTGTVSLTGSGDTTVSSVTVNGQEILSGPAAAATTNDLAGEIAKKIHACATQKDGNCARAGYDAEVSPTAPSKVILYAPDDTSAQPVVVKNGGMSVTTYAFGPLDANVAGYVKLVPITTTVNSYPKAPSRMDCAGSTCTYDEEMTNYANWHAYYRTRMQAMKTAASRSFDPIKDLYRIGYFSINNNTGADFQNIADFGGAHKKAWYDKLFAASLTEGADTPLRGALAQAGWLFAGKYNGQTLNGASVIDPMQYYCQPNVAILSTDGYWNAPQKLGAWAAGFKLDGAAVGDQDGPNVPPYYAPWNEDRPILDGGAGLRNRITEQWSKRIEPQDYSWFQRQEEEWVVDRDGYRKSTLSQNQVQRNPLAKQKHQWRTDKWILKQAVYTEHWWHNSSSVTKWKKTTEDLYKHIYRLQQQVVQREKSTNEEVTYVTGQLQRLPKQLYRKAERDLYTNVKQVYQKNKQGTGWSDRHPVETCTENANTICEFDATNDVWTQAGSCTDRGRGKVDPVSTDGDNRFTVYETKVSCRYQYSATEVNVPNTDATWPLVTSCTSQGSKGSPYTVSHEVACTSVWGAESQAQNVGSCTVEDDYTCRFAWNTDRHVWDRKSGDCVTYQGGGDAKGSTWTNPGKICYFNQNTPFTAVASCTPGVNKGVTTQCRDNPVVDTGADSSGWKDVDSCTQDPAGQYDSSGKHVNCQRRLINSLHYVASCTPINTTTDKEQYDCGWLNKSSETEVDSCTPSGGIEGNTWTAPRVTCTPVASAPTCVNSGGTWYYVDPTTGQPDLSKTCQYKWTGWSNFYPVSSCTPTGTNRWDKPQAGDVQCRYEADPNNGQYSDKVQCHPTPTPMPPSGWNNPAAFPEGVAVTTSEYRTCDDYWTSSSTSDLDTCVVNGVNVKCCKNDGVYNKCGYNSGSWTNVDACPGEVAGSSGDGADWTVLESVKCTQGYKVVNAWTETCQADDVTQCDPLTAYNQPILDANFNPEKRPLGDAKNRYHKIPHKYFYATFGNLESAHIPQATEADPSPNNAGFCEVNPPETPGGAPVPKITYGVQTDGTPDKRREITCRAVRPNPSDTFYTAACPGSDPNANTTAGQAPLASNGWVRIACGVNKAGPSVDKDCGKQPDGTLSNDIPATPANGYVRTICTPGSGDPTPNTLADVAEYYFKTDLRTPERNNCTGAEVSADGGKITFDVCSNIQGGQVMSTYTLGLGASGVMQFEEGYDDESKRGDFYSVWKGVEANPDKGVCAWQLPGTQCNWPRPSVNSQTNIDDLWHAAVNGRGIYFSAQNPEAMAAGISAALMNVRAKQGSVAAVTVTGPRLEAGSAAFQVSFTSGSWTGDVQQYKLSQDERGKLSLTDSWSARTELGKIPYANRKIRFFDANESGGLKPFEWDKLSATQKAYFQNPTLSQLCTTGTICLPPEARKDPDFAKKLVNFLRGDRSNEGDVSDLSKYFRKRTSVLGDIVDSEAVYVGKAPRSYTDNGYSAFKVATANRAGMIYVGANDGMLHAFKADTGEEAWAFVPSVVMPRLHQLADKNYQHRFFVDGTPVMGDICISGCTAGASGSVWKTILVGGLNRGGKGYYALDITDPANPKGLWEFTHANLGYTYGNPLITKLVDGTWVVLVASGYNNGSPGDGRGHLFVLKAEDGSLIRDISTGIGSSDTPSGLAKISAFATYSEYNDTALRVYGGDLLGNLWRFDINDNVGASGYDAQLLVTLKDDKGKPQPITSRPELGLIKNRPVVFVGTGQMLGAPDMGSRSKQSLYALLDRLTDATYADPRTQPALFVRQEMTAGKSCPDSNPHCPTGVPMVSVTDNPVDWANQNGWYVDFPGEGERVNTAMRLMQGTLAITTNTPQEGACVPAGVSYAYFLNFRSGSFIDGTDGMAGYQLGNDLATAGAYLQTDDGSVVGLVDRDCAGKDCISVTQPPFELPSNKARRISWRELIVE